MSLPEALLHNVRHTLTVLDLSHNSMRSVPESLCTQLLQLRKLYIKHNLITEVSDRLGLMVHLNELDFSYNQISALPDSVGELRLLGSLDVSHNMLSKLPLSAHQWQTSLTRFYAHDNPWVQPYAHLLSVFALPACHSPRSSYMQAE